jgi:hypothetical protein
MPTAAQIATDLRAERRASPRRRTSSIRRPRPSERVAGAALPSRRGPRAGVRGALRAQPHPTPEMTQFRSKRRTRPSSPAVAVFLGPEQHPCAERQPALVGLVKSRRDCERRPPSARCRHAKRDCVRGALATSAGPAWARRPLRGAAAAADGLRRSAAARARRAPRRWRPVSWSSRRRAQRPRRSASKPMPRRRRAESAQARRGCRGVARPTG